MAFGKIAAAVSSLISHLANKSNPHSVTKAQVGLGNVDNTSDANKPISTATQTALNAKQDTITGSATSVVSQNLTASRALITNSSQKITVSSTTQTELGYLSGVTRNVQTQLNGKVDTSGDTLTGMLTFNNTDAYHAIHKVRTMSSGTYGVNFGCGVLGGNGTITMELRSGSSTTGTQLARFEVGQLGVSYVDPDGNRSYLVKASVVDSTTETQ